MAGTNKKQYGLIIPNKKTSAAPARKIQRASVFDDDSDSDDAVEKPTGISQGLKIEDKRLHQKAIAEDPTIFEYDEIYDQIDEARKQTKAAKKDQDKKPKYIANLLKAAEKRKLETERRIERQVQRDREAEGDMYKDKESFITSAYKKKLEEMKKQMEQEQREEYLEAIGDVTKQGNLDGFYRHLYEQKVNYDEEKEKKMEEIKTKKKESASTSGVSSKKPPAETKTRQYRKRRAAHSSSDSDSSEPETQQKIQQNLDADSDFSIDSDSDSDTDSDSESDSKIKVEKTPKKQVASMDFKDKKRPVEKKNDDDKSIKVEKQEEEIKRPATPPPKPKIDIWAKRTVGQVFLDAQKRYFERCAQLEQTVGLE